MIADWGTVDPEVFTEKFDAYVVGMVHMISRRLVPPDRAIRSITLRCAVYDHQLARSQAARN